jgi:hypothetical protein
MVLPARWSGLMFALVSNVLADATGAFGPVTINPSPPLAPGTYCLTVVGIPENGITSFTVIPATTTIVVPVPWSICAIQLGVQESGGTIEWMPGYGYPGTPISECQNKTDVLGEDALSEAIMFHQFTLNGTSFVTTVTTLTIAPWFGVSRPLKETSSPVRVVSPLSCTSSP